LAPEIPFRFDVPIECFEKAGEEGKERRIGGIISTEHKDRQGEVVLQRGLQFDDFLGNGWFNDNHSRETTGIVGYPLEIKKTIHNGKPATYVEGYLLKNFKPADKIWDLANALQKTDRKLGFSIEGKVVRRSGNDGKTIAEARVQNVAVTNCPVNSVTGMDVLAKSLIAVEAMPDDIEAAILKSTRKALNAGASISNPGASPGEGFALRTESLEADAKVTTHPKKKKKKKKILTKSDAENLIRRRHPGIGARAVERIWKFARSKLWQSEE